jgi:hypothetical protein
MDNRTRPEQRTRGLRLRAPVFHSTGVSPDQTTPPTQLPQKQTHSIDDLITITWYSIATDGL